MFSNFSVFKFFCFSVFKFFCFSVFKFFCFLFQIFIFFYFFVLLTVFRVAIIAQEWIVSVNRLERFHEAAFICMISLCHNDGWNAQNFTDDFSARQLISMHFYSASLVQIKLKRVVNEPIGLGTVARLASFTNVMTA